MKIAGTSYEAHLDLQEDNINDIKLVIFRQKEIHQTAQYSGTYHYTQDKEHEAV